MSPNVTFREEVRLGRTAMSRRELGRVEVLSRVRSKQLRVVDAARTLRLSYRQTKRLWKRYREEGAAGLKHRRAGRRSNRAYAERFRHKVLGLVRKKYGGEEGERFGPTLAAIVVFSAATTAISSQEAKTLEMSPGIWCGSRWPMKSRRRTTRGSTTCSVRADRRQKARRRGSMWRPTRLWPLCSSLSTINR